MKLWIVTCYVQGCDECSDTYEVIGVFGNSLEAELVRKEHSSLRGHLHHAFVSIEEATLGVAQHKNNEYVR